MKNDDKNEKKVECLSRIETRGTDIRHEGEVESSVLIAPSNCC